MFKNWSTFIGMSLSRLGALLLAGATLLTAATGLHAQQPGTSIEGILNTVWGDPHPELGAAGAMLHTLVLPDGKSVALDMNGQDNLAVFYFGKRVLVSGQVVAKQMGLAQSQSSVTLVVDTIAPVRMQQGPGLAPGVFGTKKVIYLLLKFSDDVAVPHPPLFFTNLNNPDTPPVGEASPATINGFFKKTSWDQFSWIGDVGGLGGVGAAGGWLTLPHPKSYYAPCGWSSACANLQAISDDGTALGRAQGIDFKNYDNINFVLSNDLDCCAWGGGYYSSVDAKVYGATWEPPWGQETGTYAHEMGHSLGLPHSGWVYHAYDSPWDMMSNRVAAQYALCGSYVSKNSGSSNDLYCSEPGDGYITAHKDYLGWIPVDNQIVTTTSDSTTVTLEAGALPLSTLPKIMKICITGSPCSGASAHYFTVEARVKGLGIPSQYDNGLPNEGIIIHEFKGDRPAISGTCFFNSQSGWAVPIDSTPNDYDSVNCNQGGRNYPDFALYNAQWSPGQTYTNSSYGFSVSVLSRAGSTFEVALVGTTVDTRLSNISTRGRVQTGDSVMIGGFIIDGATAKKVLIRARGPSLSAYGVPGVLANPKVDLYSGPTVIASNDNWGSATNAADITATGLAPTNSLESAILTTLSPGAYTAIVSGVGNTSGVGIVEVLEMDNPAAPLINISTRGQVQTGDNVMIGGFIIDGANPQTVLIRARGPSLSDYGVPGVLADPTMEVYSGQSVIASNDNWGTATNAADITATGLAPTNAMESAILTTLDPGAYTVIVRGFNNTTGVGIVEVLAQ
ncbi:hypothetical protein [Rhodoferax sp.]|uniref:hypothetical protein n=1 Tax=Rhodoferax sp. TaxID=50421 RepID=UPI00263168D6|nr:hypothetical protein [Rhodoferax sp.]MDD2919831.1 hypothetical protein [Rhodoferax sp.]